MKINPLICAIRSNQQTSLIYIVVQYQQKEQLNEIIFQLNKHIVLQYSLLLLI